MQNITVPKNGYVYVYVCNLSSRDVYFDNLQVVQKTGPILEDSHYYPYGLKMAGISAKAYGTMKTPYQFQGVYSEFDETSGLNSFALRNYDPQIGRWTGADPYDQFPSPYTGMGNNPVNMVDPDGGWTAGATGALIGGVVGAGVLGVALPYLYEDVTGKPFKGREWWALGGALLGSGVGFGTFASLSGGSSFLREAAAFYVGLVSPRSAGSFLGEGRGSVACWTGSARAEVPNIWGWVGDIKLPSLNLSGWVDDAILSPWMVISIHNLVTEGAASQNPGYQSMYRTVKNSHSGNGYIPDDVQVHDERTVVVPSGDKTKTKLIVENETAYRTKGSQKTLEGVFSRTFSSTQLEDKYTVRIDHKARSGVGYKYDKDGNVTSKVRGYSPTESKVQVVTSRREKIGVKRLKILGIKTPFIRKI